MVIRWTSVASPGLMTLQGCCGPVVASTISMEVQLKKFHSKSVQNENSSSSSSCEGYFSCRSNDFAENCWDAIFASFLEILQYNFEGIFHFPRQRNLIFQLLRRLTISWRFYFHLKVQIVLKCSWFCAPLSSTLVLDFKIPEKNKIKM